MDSTDEEILERLNAGAIRSSSIAKKMGLPMSTVHFRIKRLEKEKIIKYYKAEIDWKNAGLSVLAFVYINIDVNLLKDIKKSQKTLLAELLKIPGVQEGYIITGDSDMMLKVMSKDTEHLSKIILEAIDSKEGITRTKTIVSL